MSRSIFTRGDPWPVDAASVETFNTNFTFDNNLPQGGLDWQMFQHHCFQWLSTADEQDVTLTSPREFLMSMPDAQGVEKPVRIIPKTPDRAININNEMSAIVWRQDWATYGLPDLAKVMVEDGVTFCRLEAHLTPLSQADNFTTLRDSFEVKSVDNQNRTITLRGKKYYRKRISTARTSLGAPQYAIGFHWGFQRYMRDQLVSDAERQLDEFKVREYNYGFIEYGGDVYRYSRVQDVPEKDYASIKFSDLKSAIGLKDNNGDYMLFLVSFDANQGTAYITYNNTLESTFDLSLLKVSNQNLLDELAGLSSAQRQDADYLLGYIDYIEVSEKEPSEHTLYMETFPDGISVNDTVSMVRRLPFVTTMLATIGTFSQKYGYWDFRLRFDRKKRQFSAAFLWTNYIETVIRTFLQRLKEMEIDVKEFPGATTPFMNTHRPSGIDSQYSMLNYAEENSLTPVIGNPEWTEATKQQHQILIPIDSPDYVDSGAWHDIRVAICPENNPLGLPENTVAWYERTADGQFKFTAGCILSPDAHNNVLDLVQCFLCNPVDGDFVADMELFAPGAASDDETLPIVFDIAHVKAYQFPGYEPGGAGLPDPNGQYPNGVKSTPNDSTGNSGEPPVSVPTQTRQAIVSEYVEAATRNDGSKLLVPNVA